MKVKVCESYKGVYGHFDTQIMTVTAKRAGDPPFIVPDDKAKRHIAAGVLEEVGDSTEATGATETQNPKGQSKESSPGQMAEGMSYREMQKAVSELGIPAFGKSKEELLAILEEQEAPPTIETADPV